MATLTMPDSLDAVSDYDRDRIPTEADEDAILLKVHDAIEAGEESATDESPRPTPEEIAACNAATTEAGEAFLAAVGEPASEPTLDALASPAPASRISATDDLLIRIQNAEHDCRRYEGIVLACKEDLKSAKADYDSAVNKLRELASSSIEMAANDANRPLLAAAEAAAESASVESASPASSSDDVTNVDTSVVWPLNRVPSLVECLIADEKLKLVAGENWNCTVEADGVCLDESTYLAAGEFRVIEWRDQQPEDVLPHFVETFRAEQAIAAEANPPSDEDSWRSFEVAYLDDLSDGTVGALHNADIETVGQLADYTAGGKLLTDIAKIGKGKQEQIENAMEKFWKERPDRKADA